MRIEKDKHDKRYYWYITDNVFIHTENEWSQLFSKYNWYEITPISVSFEYDKQMTGGYELRVIILGFGFRFRHCVEKWYKKTKLSKRLKDGIKSGK